MGALQKPELSSCRSFGFSPAPGLTSSWQAGGARHSGGLGRVERGCEMASSAVLTSRQSPFSSVVISFDRGPTDSEQRVCILQTKSHEWFLEQGRGSRGASLRVSIHPARRQGRNQRCSQLFRINPLPNAKQTKPKEPPKPSFPPLKKEVNRNPSKFTFSEHFGDVK